MKYTTLFILLIITLKFQSQNNAVFKHGLVVRKTLHDVHYMKPGIERKNQITEKDTKLVIEKVVKDKDGKEYTLTSEEKFATNGTFSYTVNKPVQADFYWTELDKKWMKANIIQKKDTLYINWWLQTEKGKGNTALGNGIIAKSPEETVTKGSLDLLASKENRSRYYDPSLVKNLSTGEFEKCQAYIILKNRDRARFLYSNWEIGAVTVPFKLRFGYNMMIGDSANTSINVKAETQTDVNLGLYAAYTIGKVSYRYRDKEEILPNQNYFSIGPLLSLSTVKLDSASTSASHFTKDEGMIERNFLAYETTRPAVSTGVAVMFGIRDIRFGAFLGCDFAFGENSSKWNYQGKPWLGFGLGYNLAFIRKIGA